MTWSKWMLENCGYKTISTFWEDFSIADKCGVNAIKDTFYNAFKYWKSDYKMLTELVIVLNHKIWQYYDSECKNEPYIRLYNDLWQQANSYAINNLKNTELQYFLRITD